VLAPQHGSHSGRIGTLRSAIAAVRRAEAAPTRPIRPAAGRVFTPVVAKAESRRARTVERHRRLRRKVGPGRWSARPPALRLHLGGHDLSPTSPLRAQLVGTEGRPRLAVFRSNEHIYAQVGHRANC
jgi:hypothetical protein